MAFQSSQRDHRRQIGEHLTSPQFWTIVKLMSYCSGCCKSVHWEHRLLATTFFLHFCVHVLLNRTMYTYSKLYFNSIVFFLKIMCHIELHFTPVLSAWCSFLFLFKWLPFSYFHHSINSMPTCYLYFSLSFTGLYVCVHIIILTPDY